MNTIKEKQRKIDPAKIVSLVGKDTGLESDDVIVQFAAIDEKLSSSQTYSRLTKNGVKYNRKSLFFDKVSDISSNFDVANFQDVISETLNNDQDFAVFLSTGHHLFLNN